VILLIHYSVWRDAGLALIFTVLRIAVSLVKRCIYSVRFYRQVNTLKQFEQEKEKKETESSPTLISSAALEPIPLEEVENGGTARPTPPEQDGATLSTDISGTPPSD